MGEHSHLKKTSAVLCGNQGSKWTGHSVYYLYFSREYAKKSIHLQFCFDIHVKCLHWVIWKYWKICVLCSVRCKLSWHIFVLSVSWDSSVISNPCLFISIWWVRFSLFTAADGHICTSHEGLLRPTPYAAPPCVGIYSPTVSSVVVPLQIIYTIQVTPRAGHLKWIVAQILEVIVLMFETTGGLVRGHLVKNSCLTVDTKFWGKWQKCPPQKANFFVCQPNGMKFLQ